MEFYYKKQNYVFILQNANLDTYLQTNLNLIQPTRFGSVVLRQSLHKKQCIDFSAPLSISNERQ